MLHHPTKYKVVRLSSSFTSHSYKYILMCTFMGHFTFNIRNLFSVLIQHFDPYISYQKPCSLSLYLLPGDAHVVLHVRENSGLNEEPFQAQSFASTLQLGSFADAALDELQNAILLLPTDL